MGAFGFAPPQWLAVPIGRLGSGRTCADPLTGWRIDPPNWVRSAAGRVPHGVQRAMAAGSLGWACCAQVGVPPAVGGRGGAGGYGLGFHACGWHAASRLQASNTGPTALADPVRTTGPRMISGRYRIAGRRPASLMHEAAVARAPATALFLGCRDTADRARDRVVLVLVGDHLLQPTAFRTPTPTAAEARAFTRPRQPECTTSAL